MMKIWKYYEIHRAIQYTQVCSFYVTFQTTPHSSLFASTILKASCSTCDCTLTMATKLFHQPACWCSCCWFCLWRTGAADDTTMVACSFTPCSQMFMTGSTYGDLRLWDLHMNQLHKEKNAHDLGVTCCTFAPNILSSGGQCKWEPLQRTLWFFS